MMSLVEDEEEVFLDKTFQINDAGIEPNRPIATNEKVIGQIKSEEVRIAYFDAVRLKSEAHRLRTARNSLGRFKKDSDDVERIDLEIYQNQLRLNKRVYDLFLEISEDYPSVKDAGMVAIRKEWTLVSLPEDPNSPRHAFEIPQVGEFFIQA